ncbi:hypothetical protein VTO73DRAFT_7793 [Trametes versicolor]
MLHLPLKLGADCANGWWPQEGVEDVLNKNVVISYPNFKFDFTIWMLGRAHRYLAELVMITLYCYGLS